MTAKPGVWGIKLSDYTQPGRNMAHGQPVLLAMRNAKNSSTIRSTIRATSSKLVMASIILFLLAGQNIMVRGYSSTWVQKSGVKVCERLLINYHMSGVQLSSMDERKESLEDSGSPFPSLSWESVGLFMTLWTQQLTRVSILYYS